ISEQDAWNGLTRHVHTFAFRWFGNQGQPGNHSGSPCRWPDSSLAVEHQVDSCSGYFELADGLAAVRRPRQQPVATWRQAVETEHPIIAAHGQAADVRERHPDVRDRLAFLVGHLSRRAVHLENRTRRGVRHLRTDGLRADFWPALKSGPGLDREPDHVV